MLAVSAGIFFAIYIWLRRNLIPASWSRPVGFAIGTVILFNCVAHLYVVNDLKLTSNVALLIIGAGVLSLSIRWLAAFLTAALGGWVLVTWQFSWGDWVHYAVMLVSSTVISIVAHVLRVRGLRELESMRIVLREVELRRKAEEERRKLEATIRHSQKLESLGLLAGGITHDFNNILTPIMGFAELAKQDLPPASATHSLMDGILVAAERGAELVKRILLFSRRGQRQQKTVDAAKAVQEAVKMIQATLPTTVEIRQHVDPACGVIFADPSEIHQVVTNLCTNGYQAIGAKRGVLEISLRPVFFTEARAPQGLKAGAYIQLSVSDTGPGVDAAVVDQIFDPFFTTKEVGRGTGLGLSVVHGIVTSYGGTIAVHNDAGGPGARFDVYFPRAKAGDSTISPAREDPVGGSERILFVDDEPEIARLGKQMIESLGYQVTVETNPQQALEIFRRDPYAFDLAMSDLTMPGITGIELAEQMKSRREGFPVILATGFSEWTTAEDCRRAGIAELLAKPYRRDQVAGAIRKILDHSRHPAHETVAE